MHGGIKVLAVLLINRCIYNNELPGILNLHFSKYKVVNRIKWLYSILSAERSPSSTKVNCATEVQGEVHVLIL